VVTTTRLKIQKKTH